MSSKGEPLLCVQIQKVLYGLLCSTLLFYRNLVKDIDTYGLHIKPYDPSVANKMINNKQMIVIWNVDDLNASHVDIFEVIKFSGYLSNIYGGHSVHRGKINDYLGIDLDYSKQVKVKVYTIKNLDSVLQEPPEQLETNAATPAAGHLFTVHNEIETQCIPSSGLGT